MLLLLNTILQLKLGHHLIIQELLPLRKEISGTLEQNLDLLVWLKLALLKVMIRHQF